MIITRHSEPTKLDTVDKLTLCRVGEAWYIQLSDDIENPKWEYLGNDIQDILLKAISLLS